MLEQEIHLIGEYQLGNLIANAIPFLFIYVTDNPGNKPDHPLLVQAEEHSSSGLVQLIQDRKLKEDHPIVLVCERGDASLDTAQTLVVAGMINVFVIEGGINALN